MRGPLSFKDWISFFFFGISYLFELSVYMSLAIAKVPVTKAPLISMTSRYLKHVSDKTKENYLVVFYSYMFSGF